MELVSYGALTSDFKVIAQLVKVMRKIKEGKVKQSRMDCYDASIIPVKSLETILRKFESLQSSKIVQMEIFYPSQMYPSHVDEGSISYFIGLEEGHFLINGVSYPIVPFVLYRFDESKPHNSNFGAIMIK